MSLSPLVNNLFERRGSAASYFERYTLEIINPVMKMKDGVKNRRYSIIFPLRPDEIIHPVVKHHDQNQRPFCEIERGNALKLWANLQSLAHQVSVRKCDLLEIRLAKAF